MEYFSDLQRLTATLLITFPRLLIVLWMLPFLTESIMQGMVRNAFGFSLVLFVFPSVYQQVPPGGFELIPIFMLFIKEVFIGVLLGFGTAMIFWVASSIGYLIDLQRGAFVATLFTPVFRGLVSPIGSLFLQVLAVLFFVGGGFLVLLDAIYSSYQFWPVLSFIPSVNSKFMIYVVGQFQWMAYFSVFLAMPVLIAMFFVDLIMGLINRFVPHLQVFFLSLPIKGALAIFILVLYMSLLGEHFIDYFDSKNRVVQQLREVFSE